MLKLGSSLEEGPGTSDNNILTALLVNPRHSTQLLPMLPNMSQHNVNPTSDTDSSSVILTRPQTPSPSSVQLSSGERLTNCSLTFDPNSNVQQECESCTLNSTSSAQSPATSSTIPSSTDSEVEEYDTSEHVGRRSSIIDTESIVENHSENMSQDFPLIHHKKLRRLLRKSNSCSESTSSSTSQSTISSVMPKNSDDNCQECGLNFQNTSMTTELPNFRPRDSKRRKYSTPEIHHPAPICIDQKHRRQLVASRDIEEGEIILKETPLISAPLEKEFFIKRKQNPIESKVNLNSQNVNKEVLEKPESIHFRPTCLTCCKTVQTGYKCTNCGFPMCSLTCQKHPDHSNYECEVFAKNPVSPIVNTNEYKKIKVLRALLLKQKDPQSWQKLMELDPHDELRAGNFCAFSTTIAICKFIQQECHLTEYDVSTINRIVGICTVHSHNTWNPTPYPISELKHNEITKSSLIFHKAGLLAHDCRPNTRSIISQTGIGTENVEITVVASSRIPKGQLLSHCFVDVTKGTFQRRSDLLENYYLNCTCRRCMDPLEYSTFYSALKCPKCPLGQLLPGNPLSLDLSSIWLCNLAPRCDFIIAASQVKELLKTVQEDVEAAAIDNSLFEEYHNLQKILNKYRGSILHKNHFYIMNIQYALIMVINGLLEIVNENEAIELSHQQIALCKSCMEVVDILRPGNNLIRGNLLYFLHEGLLMTFLVEAKKRMADPLSDFACTGRKRFLEILNIMKIGKDCLILEPIGSAEHSRALKLTLDSSGLQPLIKYFNIEL